MNTDNRQLFLMNTELEDISSFFYLERSINNNPRQPVFLYRNESKFVGPGLSTQQQQPYNFLISTTTSSIVHDGPLAFYVMS